MAKQTINIGTVANDGNGDTVRDAFDKVNDNFTEVYANDFVTNARMADDSVKAAELSTTNAASSGIDNYILSYDHASGGFTWVVQSTPDGGLIVSNPANNRIITSTGGSTGDAEANLTFDGTDLIAGGNGTSGGVTVSDGSIQMRTGTGSVAEIRMYCESSNAHFQTIKAQPHSAASSAVLTLPSATGTLVGTGDVDTITYTMLGAEFTTTDAITTELDFSGHQVFTKTMSGDTTFTFANANIGMVKDFILEGNHTPTFPAGTKTVSGTYSTTAANLIQIVAIASGDYWMSISQAI